MITTQLGFMNTKISGSAEEKVLLPRTEELEANLGASHAVRRAIFGYVFLPGSTVKREFRCGEAQFRRHGRELLRKKRVKKQKTLRVN
jgi:hypothetical protein